MGQFVCIVIGYFIGALIQTSYWYGRLKKIDIRNLGSGNAGTTNATRMLGKKAGIITAVGDVSKVFLSALICWLIYSGAAPTTLIFLCSGLGTVLGHNYPFYMGFKGGKGVATTCGVIISLFFMPNNCWIMTIIGVITFFVVLYTTGYAAVASLTLVSEFLIEFIIWGASGNLELHQGDLAQGMIIVIIIVGLTFFRHRSNIYRLLNNTEHRFNFGKNNKGDK